MAAEHGGAKLVPLIFQSDSVPAHRAKFIKTFLAQEKN